MTRARVPPQAGWPRLAGVLLALLPAAAPAAAQDEAAVEALAPLLQAEDARAFLPGLFGAALQDPDPLVRRTAATSLGRLRDPRGTPLLLDHLLDPDSTVQAGILFALGLIGDTTAAGPIRDRFTAQPGLAPEAALEGITALARMGGPDAAALLGAVLRGTGQVTTPAEPLRVRAAQDAWRLGPSAPVADLLPLAADTSVAVRIGAVFSLARLRATMAGQQLLSAMRDPDGLVRSYAARVMTRGFAEDAGIPEDAALSALRLVLVDTDPRVRINAMRAAAGWGLPALATDITPFLEDPDVNVRVQAATTLGFTGGPAAVAALENVLRSRALWAVRREALLALARIDPAALARVAGDWAQSADFRDRAALAEAGALVGPGPAGTADLTRDPDPRVVGAALDAWNRAAPEVDSALLASARRAAASPDAVVRALAADILGRAKRAPDAALLVTLYDRSARDSFPDAALSALAALDSIARSDTAAATWIRREFIYRTPRPRSYVLRRWAESAWPELAARWGPAFPIETGRTLEDYRQVARRYLVGTGPERYPKVVVETEQRGSFELELFGPDAPLTVANFLLLVDRRFFDGNRWHRVVPNFVVQDGDPRGDGWGGPGGEIRDEINRRRYGTHFLGMALSGPDTGSSQWFITLSPQPHLDGAYTLFGRVSGSAAALIRITQGDVIRTIRR